MSKDIWIPETGRLIIRHMVGNGVADVWLGYALGIDERYSQIARMQSFVSMSRFSTWHEAPAPQESMLSDTRKAMRLYATDAELKAFVFLWSDPDLTPVEWFEHIMRAEVGLRSSEKDRLKAFVTEYQRFMAH